MREMEMTKRHSSARTVVLFTCISVLIIGLFACDDRKDGSSAHSGKLRLSLAADTTSLKKGVNSNLTKAVSDEFEKFLTVEDYQIRIVTDKDTVKSYDRFDKMPSEIELPEGAYTIVASKGNDLPAAFENPYFEGSTAFTIKEGMSTPLDMTCTLGNARITAEYTDDFKEAYSDYTALLSSTFATTEFEIAKGETRPAYMQVAKEGTDVAIGIRLKKINAEEEKTYYVPTALKLERRQNVRLVFKTDGEALEGIELTIMLDDSLTKVDLVTEIPDFMWKPFDKPTLSPTEFKGDGTEVFKTTAGSFKQDLQVGVVMPGGIGSLTINYWKEGESEEDAISYDLTTDAGVVAAKDKHFTWTYGEKDEDINLLEKRTAQLYLKDGINSLESLEDKSCIYNFKISGSDATGKTHAANDLQFKVEVLPATAPIIDFKQGESDVFITEGDELATDWQLDFNATGLMDKEATKVIVNDGTSDLEYYFLKDDGASLLQATYGAIIDIESDAHTIVSFPKVFTASLLAPKEGVKKYTFTFCLKDRKGKEDKLINTITVNAPVFTLETTSNDAFAKRIVLRVNMFDKGNKAHLSFQYRPKGELNWSPVKSAGLQSLTDNSKIDQIQCVDTLKGLTPETVYSVRAVYNANTSYVRYSEEQSLLTEVEQGFRNGKLLDPLDDWSIEPDANGSIKQGYDKEILVGFLGVKLEEPWRCWEVWLPYTSDNFSNWNTLNKKTTSDGGFNNSDVVAWKDKAWTRYVANSGTIKTDGVSGSAALIRTVGWGSGNSAEGTSASNINHSDPGELYLGVYKDTPDYGIEFGSRPSGFSFQYKYENPMAGNDEFTAEIVVEDESGQMFTKQFKTSAITSVWKQKYVPLDYPEKAGKAKKMWIRFVSGNNGNYGYNDFPIKAKGTNLSNGEYTGSHLYIDNVELIYE